MGLHGGYGNRNSRERNKNEIILSKKLSLTGAPIESSQMQYGLLFMELKGKKIKNLFSVTIFPDMHHATNENETKINLAISLIKAIYSCLLEKRTSHFPGGRSNDQADKYVTHYEVLFLLLLLLLLLL